MMNKIKTRQTIGYIFAVLIIMIMGLVMFYKPGISAQNPEELGRKLPPKLEKVVPSDARITYLHLDGFGASRKFRYAIVTYLLPEAEHSYTASLYIDGTGGTFSPTERPLYKDQAYEQGLAFSEIDFQGIAQNVRRIRAQFDAEGKKWIGVSEYTINRDSQTGDFVHEVKVYYEMDANMLQWAIAYYFNVTPSEPITYLIAENGTGELKLKEGSK